MKIDIRHDGLRFFLTVTRTCADCGALHVIERDISNETARMAFAFLNFRFDIQGCLVCRPGAWGEPIDRKPDDRPQTPTRVPPANSGSA